MSPDLCQALSDEPVSISNAVLDAPEFPDFDNSEVDTTEEEVVDIGALELETLDFVSVALPEPEDPRVSDSDDPQPDLAECGAAEPTMYNNFQDLNLGNQNIIPLDPDAFSETINLPEFPESAEPEQYSQSEEVSVEPPSTSQADEADAGAAEFDCGAQDTNNSNLSVSNDENKPQPR